MKKVELLAPAGDMERLKVAYNYGADACYIGGSEFSLRANANNFSLEEIKEAVDYAHKLNRKLYVTVNIALHNAEVADLDNYIRALSECDVDAVIVSDPAIIDVCNKYGVEVHISTQQSTLNYEAIKLLKKLGATRVVLAREATCEDAIKVKEKVDMELECFIHGAMCASYSGRCVLSNFLTARDANRGGCSQICRWDFDLLDSDDNHIKGDKPFTFCTKDLSMLKVLGSMLEAGIDSLKIEGRMRSIYYIATVVSVYRKVIDNYYKTGVYTFSKQDELVLDRVANRESIPQFWDGNFSKNTQYYNGRVEVSNQDFLGVIIDIDSNNNATIEQRNYFKLGDSVEIFGTNNSLIKFEINKIIDLENNVLEVVNHPKQIVKIKLPEHMEIGSFMRASRE